jgi:esterase/lipase
MVLIHGLTECPYAMRTLAKIAFEHGYFVIAPRMPGHGTTPGSLARAKWQDWVAVVRMACAEARRLVGPGKPLILCGYSNGGLLSAKYALDELEKGGAGEPPQKLVLLSPAIGITQFAAVSGWHRALTVFPYFHKVAWLSIEPEYDPFKFNSFPKMAGDQIFRLTKVVERQMKDLEAGKGFARFPPVLAFTSVVDSTVLVPSLVDRLFSRLAANGSRLVLYDVNRCNAFAKFIKARQTDLLASLDRLVPRLASYRHGEGNADAHIKSALLGHSVSVPVTQGRLALGTWQGIFLCEFDGPRTRHVVIDVR